MPDRTFLNHVNMVFPPGDRDAAYAFCELLGFNVQDTPPWISVGVEPSESDNWADNVLYAAEAIPAQVTFEKKLAQLVAGDPATCEALEHYKSVRRAHPQLAYHWGVHVPTHDDWQARVAHMQDAAANHPLLKGRVEVLVFEPETNPHSISTQSQAFVRTDVLAAEGFAFGLEIELQWTPVDDNGRSSAGATGYFPGPDELR